MAIMKKVFFSGVLCCACLLLKAQTPSTGSAGPWQPGHFLWFTGHWSQSGGKTTFIISKPIRPAAKPPMGATFGGAPSSSPDNPGDPDAPANPPGGGTININSDGSIHLNND